MEGLTDTAGFLASGATRVILDVRSPGEYAQGHIPGALSFPLFTDEERAKVGTCYKQQGPEPALRLGLKFVGPKMSGFVGRAAKMAPQRRIAVHCWRGGKRSQSMAWLLRTAGFDVITLAGGYKSYRNYVLENLGERRFNLRILGGKTGSGKTKILRALPKHGFQIIDLELIAHHKGSAFGSIGETPQPTVEQFENDLFAALQMLDPTRPTWIENESHSIGRVFIPEPFWKQMKEAPLYNIEIPQEARIRNLLDDYVLTDKAELKTAFLKIDRKLGGQHLKTALEALERDDFAAAAEIALRYYDKTYQFALEQNQSPEIHQLNFDFGNPEQIAQVLAALPD